MDLSYCVNNGYHVILTTVNLLLVTQNFRLCMYIYLKWYSYNYYKQFCHLYPEPNVYKWKHMIRLTDTSHIANFLSYYYTPFLPVAHNIHFAISTGYYLAIFFLGMKDVDQVGMNTSVSENLLWIHEQLNHTVPYLISMYTVYNGSSNIMCTYEFNTSTLLYSYLWLYVWVFFIYIPWRWRTSDPVYSVLGNDSSITMKIKAVCTVHLFIYFGNCFGRYLTNL